MCNDMNYDDIWGRLNRKSPYVKQLLMLLGYFRVRKLNLAMPLEGLFCLYINSFGFMNAKVFKILIDSVCL